MTAALTILRAGPLSTIQDEGRFGMLRHGISASGPMDQGAFHAASVGGRGAIEITRTGLAFRMERAAGRVGFGGGTFSITIDDVPTEWPGEACLAPGSTVLVTPGPSGNYGYLRFERDISVSLVMGSMATSSRVQLGGVNGRSLQAGDVIELASTGTAPPPTSPPAQQAGPFRFVWGVHALMFDASQRQRFLAATFSVSSRLDRMGVRLIDDGRVFAGAADLSLVSEAIVPGDVQIMGDGTPIVLMRDHQPTGGYPRLATIITADFDRFAQMRPGSTIAFEPVTVKHAQRLLRSHP